MIDVESGSVLIVDDEPSNVRFLVRLLERRGYSRVQGLRNGAEALERLRAEPADLLLLDLHMPDMDGFAVMRAARELPGCAHLPILILTGDDSRDVRNRALSSGARDFLTKPFDSEEALLRIQNLLMTRMLHRALSRQNEELEDRVRQRTEDLEQAQVEILSRLAAIAEHHDEETAEHTQRVADLSRSIGLAMGLDEEEATLIGRASLLHDVGKISVPTEIIHLRGPLSDTQRRVMNRHAATGAKLLSGSRFKVLQQAEEIAHTHHERWDGTGYPRGLAGTDIPLAGRIVAAADVYDALISERPYKAAFSREFALAELRRIRGSHLDPDVVDALERVVSGGDSRQGLTGDWRIGRRAAATASVWRPAI
ncbi:MAG TPA: HD domain-containing phosphohydrolase [Longimicrobiales bacterium]|nr:HD domain-containing phosphohydrolase [Longimicrobiales bacterium]